MSIEENKAIAHRLFEEVFRKNALDTLDEIVATDVVDHSNGTEGLEAYKQMCSAGFAGFPDCYFTTDDIIAEGNRVVVRWTARATHTEKWMNISPTNKKVMWTGMQILRVADSKVIEIWEQWDGLGFFQQLGVIPPLGEG